MANEIPPFEPPTGAANTETRNNQPDPVETLRAQLENERRARVEAENRANTEAQTAHQAKIDVADNQLQLVTSAIARVQEASDQLEGAYAQALEAQDHRAAAKIQRQLAANEARLLQLENGKAAMEAEPKPTAPQPIRTMAPDPVEQFASQLTKQSAAWVRQHPDCVTDPVRYHQMLAAHNQMVKDGVQPDTPAYFKGVEAMLFGEPEPGAEAAAHRESGEDPMAEAAQKATERARPPPAAPVSRGGSTGRSASLTAAEREIAESCGMTPEEYARNRENLKREGRYH